MRDEIDLLTRMVGIPSVSGDEEALARFTEDTARGWGLDTTRDELAVRVEVRGRRPGGTLALVSHLDVVPPGNGWTRDPFTPTVEGHRLYGRGSGDAKASVSAMLWAARDLASAGGPDAGRLLVILGYGEETKHTTMERAVETVGEIDAAVVGEPTNLDFAVAQRGLMMVDLLAEGDQRHAGYAAADGEFRNAALVLARDLLKLDGLFAERSHPVLGHTTATPTMLDAGVSRNVTPPVAKAILDIRSTPDWTHDEVADVLRQALASNVVVTSQRLVPCETPRGSRLLTEARRIRPAARTFGSPTCSDWVFLRHTDAVKCGPGTSRRSHTPDEYVDLPEVTAARRFYRELAAAYLGSVA
ncbi:MAG TPA: M20/M25/M40 family metallo-hydrolase [Gemmatimonadales bacterium]|nr:M20/M25/M40 family metallo-hydrolase [Gemmatimonadales bacterium]